jgi:hypothetical protein
MNEVVSPLQGLSGHVGSLTPGWRPSVSICHPYGIAGSTTAGLAPSVIGRMSRWDKEKFEVRITDKRRAEQMDTRIRKYDKEKYENYRTITSMAEVARDQELGVRTDRIKLSLNPSLYPKGGKSGRFALYL